MEVASGMRLITSSFSVVTGVASRVQAHRREGERSSPDSGDPSARDPKAHPRTAHHQNQITVAHPDGRYGADLTGTHDQNGSPENQHQALTGYLGAPIRLTGAQTIELSAGATDYTSIAGDGPALVLLRG
jgi:hypothetical protein